MITARTPRLLQTDAYTLGSEAFESPDAITQSSYYLTFRKFPHSSEPAVFNNPMDNRIVFMGVSSAVNKFLSKPITHEEIDTCVEFLKNRKYLTNGLANFDFPVKMLRRVVDEFRGFMPVAVYAIPEGSVCYPNEPVVRVFNIVPGFGQLAAWFEVVLMNYCWSQTARLTVARHWLERNIEFIQAIEKCSYEEAMIIAQLQVADFGARSAICPEETESLGMVHLLVFGGTDSFAGAYQAWANEAPSYIGGSVPALAHRIVQSYVKEGDCYNRLYDCMPNNSILSFVADCYSYHNAVSKYLIPLAKRSVTEGNGKVVVVRPDSGDALEQILWTLREAVKEGLYEERNGLKYATTLRLIEGDNMTFTKMAEINNAVLKAGFAPHGWFIYGVGGYLRNAITRDMFSTKYALYECNGRPVVKNSEVAGKRTLPKVNVIRDILHDTDTTICLPHECPDGDIMVCYYYDGIMPLNSKFPTIQHRVLYDFNKARKFGGRCSDQVHQLRDQIIQGYLDENKVK